MKEGPVYALVIGGFFERLSSHWCYDTQHFKVLQRVYTDDIGFAEKVLSAISDERLMAICFAGKDAAVVAQSVDCLVREAGDEELKYKYKSVVKAVRIQNTNLPNNKYNSPEEALQTVGENSSGASWLSVALDYDFDIISTQTYGNAEIINSLKRNNSARYLPFAYNDRRFYPRDQEKQFDIGMYFKVERHSNRLKFIDYIMKLVYKNGWKFCLSNGYWGDDYAEQLGKARIILHYSYVGDVPYRLYETAGSKGCFLTDKLKFGVESIFLPEIHYFEYNRELTDLEHKIDWILTHDKERNRVEEAAYEKASNNYTWEIAAEKIVAPVLLSAYYKKRIK